MDRTKEPKVDHYLAEGCGRCPLGGTPDCKVHDWREELEELRRIVLDCGLTEELKWGVPCYTFRGHNVVIVSALKDYCALSFFKGALLGDPEGILSRPGEHTQAGRLVRITDVRKLAELEPVLKAYVHEAIEVEKAGLKVERKKDTEAVPEEFRKKLDEDPALKNAFEALTPGRQRGYLLYFSGAKRSATRASRVEKCLPMILEGKGLHDR